jgi:peptidyl-dipeptidase Dcp
MTSLRDQQSSMVPSRRLVINLQFLQGADGEPSLLLAGRARTLFHEFGHGLHGCCRT